MNRKHEYNNSGQELEGKIKQNQETDRGASFFQSSKWQVSLKK